MSKEVQKSTRGKNLKLFIFQQLKIGKNPARISEEFGIQLNKISYHLSSLKRDGIVAKTGYGCWEIKKDLPAKQVQKSSRVGRNNSQKFELLLKPDSVRGHAFQFVLQLPENLRNWNRREELLTKAGIKFDQLKHIFGGGQRLILRGRKVHLTSKSIIIYEKASFIADLASESQSKAISHFLSFVKSLERHLRANFSFYGKYRFRVARQHYALIKNALARQYDQENKKLHCYTGEGLWMLIDNSFNLHELETVHPKTAVTDNERVQKVFNRIKTGEFDPDVVMNEIGEVQKMMKESSATQMMMSQVMQQMEKNQIRIIKKLGEGQ